MLELLDHVVSGNLWVAELAAGKTIQDVGDRLDGSQLGGDFPKSVSTDHRRALPADLVDTCWAVLEPQLADLQASGAYGTEH